MHLLMSLSIQTGYHLPPPEIVALVDAPETPDVAVSPDRRWLLLMQRPSLPSIEELAQPERRLGGLRINPRTNGPSRANPYHRLTLLHVASGEQWEIAGLPDRPRLDDVSWSPGARYVAFTLSGEAGLRLYVADRETKSARQVGDVWLNAAYGAPFHWQVAAGGRDEALVCKIVPPDRGPAPPEPVVPGGPVIQENDGKVAAAWTFQDLLQNAYDEALFEHYLLAQVVRFTLDGAATPLGAPALIRRAAPSPDGNYLLVETLHRPFSYLVPAERFPTTIGVWDAQGRVVRRIADLPLAEEVPTVRNAVRTGPRQAGWRADAPATLCWVEALDAGDPRVETAERDRVFTLAAPFQGAPQPLITLGYRLGRVVWGHDHLAIVEEQWWKTRRDRRWILAPSAPDVPPRLWIDRSQEDRYHDPGWPLLRSTPAGTRVLLTRREGASDVLFLAGDGASPEGDRPFLDCHRLNDQVERLWRSEPPHYEHVITVLDEDGLAVLTGRESADEPPSYCLRDLLAGTLRHLTGFPHPAPQLAGVRKELIRYQRADGVQLTGMLYTPPGRQLADGPLPLLMWAYPQEYKSAGAAGQVRGSPYRFTRPWPGSPLYLLTQGYAILDNPTMPIVGEGDQEPNDSYVEQLVAGAKAAVDAVVSRGVADPQRIAVGGHSYGGFMTANLLAHSDLFRAGIARSGAYNRTLTPFGFQAEERTLWQAPEVYLRMSPFLYAHKIKAPLLLIHGEADNNAGTYPIQSERLYEALKGHGATVRLVMLPCESHGYRARESVLHMLYEMWRWLEQHVKRSPDPSGDQVVIRSLRSP
jgi:dipeptidyl aminopeptidase/acylaminoacyl peptidase